MKVTKFSICILLFIFCACDSLAYSTNLNQFLFNERNFQFVDLTQNIDGQRFKKVKARSWYKSENVCTDERTGTHIDSKYYNPSEGDFVDRIPLEQLIIPLIIADISDKVNGNPDFVLYKYHLDYFLNNYFGLTNQPCIVVFKFGWSQYFYDKQKYFGEDANNTLHFPGISEEVAQWITSSYKNIVGVGVDLPSVDAGSTGESAVHQHLTTSGLYVVQNIKLDQPIPEAWCTALILPLKTSRGSPSSPVRLVAICPKSKML